MNNSDVSVTPTKNTLLGLDPGGLYEHTLIVDPEHGEITILTPVTVGHLRDVSRPRRFFSSVTVTVRGTPRQIRFEIEAGSLAEAVQKWLETAGAVGQKAIEEIEAQMFKSALTVPAGARMPPAKPN